MYVQLVVTRLMTGNHRGKLDEKATYLEECEKVIELLLLGAAVETHATGIQ